MLRNIRLNQLVHNDQFFSIGYHRHQQVILKMNDRFSSRENHEQYQHIIENPLKRYEENRSCRRRTILTQMNIPSATGRSYHGDVGIRHNDDGSNGQSSSSL